MHLDDALRDDATALQSDLAELRHRLHRVPEVGLQLPRTQEIVLAALDGLPPGDHPRPRAHPR